MSYWERYTPKRCAVCGGPPEIMEYIGRHEGDALCVACVPAWISREADRAAELLAQPTVDALREEIADNLERRIVEVMRAL